MTKDRFEELTKELLETCKKEAVVSENTLWPYYFLVDNSPDGDTAKAIAKLQEFEKSLSVVKDCIEKGNYYIKDIQIIYDYVYDKPFANGDEEIEYVAILKGLKVLED